MSAARYYLRHGRTPLYQATAINSRDTIVVFSPSTNRRMAVTDLVVSTNVGGTIAFYINEFTAGARPYNGSETYDDAANTYDGVDQNIDSKLFEFFLRGSAMIVPDIGVVLSDRAGVDIVAVVGASATDGWTVSMSGFDLP